MVLDFRFGHWKCPNREWGKGLISSESGLFLTLGSGTSSARNENLRPLLNRNIPLISGKYGLRWADFDLLQSIYIHIFVNENKKNYHGGLILSRCMFCIHVRKDPRCKLCSYWSKKNSFDRRGVGLDWIGFTIGYWCFHRSKDCPMALPFPD